MASASRVRTSWRPTGPRPAHAGNARRARRVKYPYQRSPKPRHDGVCPTAENRVPAAKEVVIKTGNAAGVEVSFNGQPLPSLGEENQMATVTFTAAGLRR